MKYTFDSVVRILIALAVILAILLFFSKLSGVLLPFFVGWLIAYLIRPLVVFFQKKLHLKSDKPAIVLSLLVIALFVCACVALVVPLIVAELSRASTLLSLHPLHTNTEGSFIGEIVGFINDTVAKIDFGDLLLSGVLGKAAEHLLPGVFSLISGTWRLVAALFAVVITLLYIVFILADYDKINKGFRSLLPPKYKPLIETILEDVEKGMNSYFRGQALVAFIVGVLFAIGFKIIGLPLGITIGLIIGVLNLVPYLQTVGIAPVLFLAWIQSAETGREYWVIVALCAAVFVVVQSLQDLVLVPKIMSKAMGLRPAVILLSLSIWGALLGFTGMIIALPLTSLMISYYKRYIIEGKRFTEIVSEN